MIPLAALALLTLPALALAYPCGDYEQVTRPLERRHGEQPVLRMMTPKARAWYEVWTGPHGWSIVRRQVTVLPDRARICAELMAAGTEYQRGDRAEIGGGDRDGACYSRRKFGIDAGMHGQRSIWRGWLSKDGAEVMIEVFAGRAERTAYWTLVRTDEQMLGTGARRWVRLCSAALATGTHWRWLQRVENGI